MNTIISVLLKLSPEILEALLPALVPLVLNYIKAELAKPEKRAEWLALISMFVSMHREVANDVSGNDGSLKYLEAERQKILQGQAAGTPSGET